MRFYTKEHKYYCGIDLHARTMFICILDQAGAVLFHRLYLFVLAAACCGLFQG